MVSRINQQHMPGPKLDAARRDILNQYHRCDLPMVWGSGRAVAADGTMMDVYDENLLAEYHIRYGDYGGIAYHHVSDQYVALFSRFVSCGTWEAIYILDVLLESTKNPVVQAWESDTAGQKRASCPCDFCRDLSSFDLDKEMATIRPGDTFPLTGRAGP